MTLCTNQNHFLFTLSYSVLAREFTMTGILPRFILIRPAASKGYACSINETNEVICQEKDVFTPFVKIEVEHAKINANFIHLRFYHTNKYWARSDAHGSWIAASSDQPEEDASRQSCTLFEPNFNDQILLLTHVQSGGRVHVDAGARFRVDDDAADSDCAFAVLDWDTLVKLPKRVAFRGDNGRYLKSVVNVPYLQFSLEDFDGACAAYKVHLNEDGYVRVKSEASGKFWRYSDANWIYSDSTDDEGRDKHTLFWPVKIGEHSIALRNTGNGYFCRRVTADDKTDCLNAGGPTITKDAILVVEEVLLERKICNVRYRMEHSRVFNEEPFVAGIGFAATSTTFTFAYKDAHTYSFRNSSCIKTGVDTTIEAGVPSIVEGRIEVSGETARPLEWGKKNMEEEKITEGTYTVTVAANSQVRVNYVGTRGVCSVPFSYTQVDRSYGGEDLFTEHIDGMFTGVNCYNFRFEETKMEPL